MIIKIDSREPKSMEMFAKTVDEKLEFERKFMTEGDYVCGGICIERKEISDFCGSIISGRLEGQIEKMKKVYKNIIVVIVGGVEKRQSEIHENCIWGMISKLLVEHKVNCLMVPDEFAFIYLMKRIFEREEEMVMTKSVEEVVTG